MENKTGVFVVRRPSPQSSRNGRIADASPRVRIVFGETMRLGPGKVDLLEAIDRTGSISAAGRDLRMSYRRAWVLIDEVNKIFSRPVVVASPGGTHGGGARLTDFGRALTAAYRRIEERTRLAIREELAPFETDLVGKRR